MGGMGQPNIEQYVHLMHIQYLCVMIHPCWADAGPMPATPPNSDNVPYNTRCAPCNAPSTHLYCCCPPPVNCLILLCPVQCLPHPTCTAAAITSPSLLCWSSCRAMVTQICWGRPWDSSSSSRVACTFTDRPAAHAMSSAGTLMRCRAETELELTT